MKSYKQMRENRGLTQQQASKILDITKEYLSAIEGGRRKPGDNLKVKMSKLYQVSIEEIFLAIKETKCFKGGTQ